jgi:hypothetical protein
MLTRHTVRSNRWGRTCYLFARPLSEKSVLRPECRFAGIGARR